MGTQTNRRRRQPLAHDPGEIIRLLDGRVHLYYGISRPGNGERLQLAVV
jgi:hypothetical protein